MKTILTAIILLTAVAAFSESVPQLVTPVTNSVTATNENDIAKTKKPPAKPDAYTGATRKAKKQN